MNPIKKSSKYISRLGQLGVLTVLCLFSLPSFSQDECLSGERTKELTFTARMHDANLVHAKRQFAIKFAQAHGVSTPQFETEERLDEYIEVMTIGTKPPRHFVEPWRRYFGSDSYIFSPLDLTASALTDPLSRDYVFKLSQIKLPKIFEAASKIVHFQNGGGSGVIIAPGYLLTAEHVGSSIDYRRESIVYKGVTISLKNSHPLRSKYLTDDLDIYFINVPELEAETALPIAQSDPSLDEALISIGYPNRFDGQLVLTTGARICFNENDPNPFHDYKSFEVIHSTNNIFIGNSGGALVNASGEFVGLTFAAYGEDHVATSYRASVVSSLMSQLNIPR